MTLMNIGGAMVIFEGINRLRWVHRPPWLDPAPFSSAALAPPEGTANRILGHVWPDNGTRVRLHRLIDQHHRVVVVLDDCEPRIELARNRVPQVPVGAVELDGSDNERCLLSVPPLTWLPTVSRRRGEEFIARSGGLGMGTSEPRLLVEDELLGTREPLRFAFQTAPITIDVLCGAIDRLFRVGPSAIPDVAFEPSGNRTPRFAAGHRRAA